MQEELTTALATINTSINQQDGRIEEMAGVVKTLNSVVGKGPSVDITPIANELMTVGEALIAKMEERLPSTELLSKLQESLDKSNASLEKAGTVLLEAEAHLTGKKVIDGVVVDKTWWDHTKSVAAPLALTTGGVILGIATWEGGRAAYGWVTSDGEEPVGI